MITQDQLKDVLKRADDLYRYLDIDRKKIEFEEEMERKFKRIRYERAELTDALNEAKDMIADQHKQIVEQQNQLAAMMATSIKALLSVGIAPDQIAAQLKISIDEVNKVLGK